MENNKLQNYFLFTILAIVFVLVFFIFKPFLTPLILAIVFAVVFRPVHEKILSYSNGRKSLSAIATTVIILICLVVPVTFLGIQVFEESRGLYFSLTDGDAKITIDTVAGAIAAPLDKISPRAGGYLSNISSSLDVYAKQGLTWIIQNMGAAVSSVMELLFGALIFFVALYYFLRDGGQFRKTLFALSPLALSDDEAVSDKMELAVNSVIKGILSVALVQGILTAIGFTIFGVPNGVFWGSVAAVAALVPAIGTGLVIVPGIIFLLLTGSIGPAVGLLLWGLLAVGLVDNFLSAKLMGKGMKLHPLMVLLSVLGGIVFFGPVGLFLGPLILSLLIAFLSIYSSQRKTQHNA